MEVKQYLYNLISGRTGKERTIDSELSVGDWNFIQLGNYTSASPLSIASTTTAKITFQQSDITFTQGRDLVLNYDFSNQKFMPQNLNDVFLVEVRLKCKCSIQNGYATIKLESPSFAYNPVQAQTFGVPKAANQEQFVSLSVPVFIGTDVKTNGLEVKFNAESGNFQVYDVSLMIVRISSSV